MNAPIVVTAEEVIKDLTDIVEKYGDVPVVIARTDDKAAESIGRPTVVSLAPSGTVDGFQAYDYKPLQDTQVKAVLFL